MPGVVRYWGPYLYRSAFHATTEAEECERALQHLRDTITVEGPHTVAAKHACGTALHGERRGDPRGACSAR